MLHLSAFISIVGMSAGLFQTTAAGWSLQPANDVHGEVLSLAGEASVSYRLECAAGEIIVTETGVTKLMDLKSGKQIDDGPGAVMPAGAAVMAVFVGKGQPEFQPAAAVKNPAGGWNLTIRLPKDDKQLKAVGKSEMMSLFTTGYTTAVAMNADDRALWSGFLQRCRTAK